MTQSHGSQLAADVSARLRDVPDFPQPGILFKDFTPVLADAALSARVADDVVQRHAGRIDAVVGIEARGFIFGAVVAQRLSVAFVPVRKAGKLPRETHSVSYDLEYGSATLELHVDAFSSGARVLVVDDVLATGGTLAATIALIQRTGAVVAAVEVILEIEALEGRRACRGVPIRALIRS